MARIVKSKIVKTTQPVDNQVKLLFQNVINLIKQKHLE